MTVKTKQLGFSLVTLYLIRSLNCFGIFSDILFFSRL